MSWLAAPAVAAAAYYLLAIAAALRWRRSAAGVNHGGPWPPISILKPVHGRDPRFYEAILSHAKQDYPEFELLFGTRNANDPALEDVARLAREFPQRTIRATVVDTLAPNAKAGVLDALAKQARYPLLLVNDSDIAVEPGYLRAAAAPLDDPSVGIVTALYRGGAESQPGRWEALGIATEFASVLVARLIGVSEFALGSTMAFRAADLERIGGFAAIENYLADDYQLGLRISNLGLRVVFAPTVVETSLGHESWAGIWRHQLRWSRTIRVSRPAGYYGYIVTHATLWALVAMAAGEWVAGAAALAIRLAAGVLVGAGILGDRAVYRELLFIPLRDLWGFAAWMAGLAGDTVEWRGRRLRLSHDGRIAGAGEGRG